MTGSTAERRRSSRLMVLVTPRFWPAMIDPEPHVGRSVVAAIAAVGDDAVKGAPICASIAGRTVASVWPS